MRGPESHALGFRRLTRSPLSRSPKAYVLGPANDSGMVK